MALALLCLVCASGCADAEAGALEVTFGKSASDARAVRGWMFVSRDSSRFSEGTLLYGEFSPAAHTLGILELDIPDDSEIEPVLRYQERRGSDIVFDGTAHAGAIELPIEEEDCTCSSVAFALHFADRRATRLIDAALFRPSRAACAQRVTLENLDEPVRVTRKVACDTAPQAERRPPPPSSSQVPENDPSDDANDGCSDDSQHDEVIIACGTSTESDPEGCTSEEDEPPQEDSREATGCEGDSTEAEGCGETSEPSSEGCEGDDVESDDAAACAVFRSHEASPLRRRRPPQSWSAQANNALTILLALAWLRARRFRAARLPRPTL